MLISKKSLKSDATAGWIIELRVLSLSGLSKTMLDNFKVKSKKSHKMDEGKNISYPQSVHHEYGCVNTIYEGGEWE